MTAADDQPGGQLQALLDRSASGAVVELPAGEYEGPLSIRRPLILSGGSGAAIWASNGPVITVESSGVSLRNLTIQVTDMPFGFGSDETCALYLRPEAADLHTENVEVAGSVTGVRDEEGDWVFPTRFDVGEAACAPGAELEKTLILTVPVACSALSSVAGLTVEPATVPAGTHSLRLRVDRMATGGELSGDLILKTRLVSRRIGVSGRLTITAPTPPAPPRRAPEAPLAPRPQRAAARATPPPPSPPQPASAAPRQPLPARPAARAAVAGAALPSVSAATSETTEAAGSIPVTAVPPPLRAARNPVALAALASGSLAVVLEAFRLLSQPSNPWIGRAALVMGSAALLGGVGAQLLASRSAGAGAGRSRIAIAAAALVLVLHAWAPAPAPGLASISNLRSLPVPASGGEPVTALALSPDGSHLASGGGDQTVRIFSTRTGKLKWQRSTHDGTVRALAISPGGKTLASGGDTPKVSLWRAADGELLKVLRGHSEWTKPVASLAFSPDGGLLAAGAEDGVIRLWDAQTSDLSKANEPSTLTRHDDAVLALAFSADGKWLASGGKDRKVLLWDLGKVEAVVFRGFDDEVVSVAVANDGRVVAAGMKDGTIRLWERSDTRPKMTLAGHAGPVRAVLFSADARILASVAETSGMTLWDLQTGSLIRTLPATAKPATVVGLAAAGAVLATASSDGTLDVWRSE